MHSLSASLAFSMVSRVQWMPGELLWKYLPGDHCWEEPRTGQPHPRSRGGQKLPCQGQRSQEGVWSPNEEPRTSSAHPHGVESGILLSSSCPQLQRPPQDARTDE